MSEQTINESAAPVAEGQVNGETSSDNQELEANESEEGSEATSESKNAKEAAAIEKKLKKLQLKIDGKVEDLEFDPNDDEFLTKQFQMAKVSQKRMQEKAELERGVKEFIDQLRKNPRKVLADPTIGVDVKEFARAIIEEEIANSQKSPEQIEKEELQAKLKELMDEREREKEEFKRQEEERLEQQAYERYDIQMTQALEKSDLPKSPYVVKKMANALRVGLVNGLDLSPEDVLPYIREEIMNDIKDMFAVMPEEVIEQMVGKEKINALRKKRVAAAKQAPVTASAVKDTGVNEKKEGNEQKKISIKEFLGI